MNSPCDKNFKTKLLLQLQCVMYCMSNKQMPSRIRLPNAELYAPHLQTVERKIKLQIQSPQGTQDNKSSQNKTVIYRIKYRKEKHKNGSNVVNIIKFKLITVLKRLAILVWEVLAFASILFPLTCTPLYTLTI